jgi:hypothetical protein
VHAEQKNISMWVTNDINVEEISYKSVTLVTKQTHHKQIATGKVDHTMVESASSPE